MYPQVIRSRQNDRYCRDSRPCRTDPGRKRCWQATAERCKAEAEHPWEPRENDIRSGHHRKAETSCGIIHRQENSLKYTLTRHLFTVTPTHPMMCDPIADYRQSRCRIRARGRHPAGRGPRTRSARRRPRAAMPHRAFETNRGMGPGSRHRREGAQASRMPAPGPMVWRLPCRPTVNCRGSSIMQRTRGA